MSKLEVENLIAAVIVQPLSAGQHGPVLGSVNAHAIVNALSVSGYVVVPKSTLTKLRATAADVLKALDTPD